MENVLSLLNVIGEFANFRYITGPPQATESAVQNTAPAGDTIADIPAVPNLVKAAIQGVIDSVPEAEFAARLDAITTAIKNRDSTSTPL